MDFNAIQYELPSYDINLEKYDINPIFTDEINRPCLKYGFNHFIHITKDKMDIVNEMIDKKYVFYVLNEFERYVDEYDGDINIETNKFLEIDEIPIMSRGFYKLWEILVRFKLIDINKEIKTLHLAEGPGSFIQATILYRDKFKKSKSKNDKYYGITLFPEEGKPTPDIEKKFIKYYDKEKPKRVYIHKTYPKKIADGDKMKDNGDLTDKKTIENLKNEVEEVDFVTADGGFEWENENTQEQEMSRLMLGQMISACNLLKKNGNFVCKLFETMTQFTLKLIFVIMQMFEKTVIYKPFMSRKSNSEKYIIFEGFNKNIKLINELEKLLEGKFIIDFYPDVILPDKFIEKFIEINNFISNRQMISINEIVKFIKNGDFKGIQYSECREKQIEASKFWKKEFL